MKEDKNNGLLPGWPPFADFKRDIANLVDDKIEPLKRDLSTVKDNLVSHIQTSNKNFKDLSVILDSLVSHIQTSDKNFADIKLTLSNHITDTNKKIEMLNERFDDFYEVIVKYIKNKS